MGILKDMVEKENQKELILKLQNQIESDKELIDNYRKLSIKYDEQDKLQKEFINLLKENRDIYKDAAMSLKEEKDILIAKMENIKSYLFDLASAIDSGIAKESIIATINEKITK